MAEIGDVWNWCAVAMNWRRYANQYYEELERSKKVCAVWKMSAKYHREQDRYYKESCETWHGMYLTEKHSREDLEFVCQVLKDTIKELRDEIALSKRLIDVLLEKVEDGRHV